MRKIYIVRKYVQADSIEEALRKEKKIAPCDCWLTDYSQIQHLEEISPRQNYEKERKSTKSK